MNFYAIKAIYLFEMSRTFRTITQSLLAPVISTILGSEIIEIHVTLDKHKDFIDNNVSLDFDEMKELVRQIRIVDSISK